MPGKVWRGGDVIGEDLGFEVEADGLTGVGAGCGVGRGAAGAGAVELGVEAGEAEELFGVGGRVGAGHAFFGGEGNGDGGEGEVVALVGELRVELVADEGFDGVGHGDVAGVDAVGHGVGGAIGAAAVLGVEELVVPDEGDVSVVTPVSVSRVVTRWSMPDSKEGRVFSGRRPRPPRWGGDVEVFVRIAGGAFFGEDLLQDVGAISDETVDAHADLGADGLGVVGVPGNDAEAGGVEIGDGDGLVEDGGVVWREDGADFDAVLAARGPRRRS